MRKLVAILLVFVILVSMPMACYGQGSVPKEAYTFLVVGHDHAAANTDVLLLVKYIPKDNSMAILQIPRDTYYHFGGSQNKINQIYPTLAGQNPSTAQQQKAMQGLSKHIEQVCGLNLDGYMSLTLDDVGAIVDALGGVDLHLPCPISYTSAKTGELVTIEKGHQHLMGEGAIQFVRYRKGYLEGDIGRVDAQKQFMWAVFSKIGQQTDISALFSLAKVLYRRVHTNIPLPTLLLCARQLYLNASATKLTFITLPGQSVRQKTNRGLWYYAVCKAEAERVMQSYFGGGTFDPTQTLNCKTSDAISAIYHAPACEVRIWQHEDITKLDIKTIPNSSPSPIP